MLKIKDEIDLKELEKFGFKYYEEDNCYYKRCIGTFNKFLVSTIDDIDTCKGQIMLFNESQFGVTLYLDSLYDLIQAGLVEKVGD